MMRCIIPSCIHSKSEEQFYNYQFIHNHLKKHSFTELKQACYDNNLNFAAMPYDTVLRILAGMCNVPKNKSSENNMS